MGGKKKMRYNSICSLKPSVSNTAIINKLWTEKPRMNSKEEDYLWGSAAKMTWKDCNQNLLGSSS